VQFALNVPTIRDRVVQTAAKLLLEPIFEADFDPNAYGYRPKRSAQDAVGKVVELLRAGYTDVVDADLSKYFDTIPHWELIQCVARRVVDRDMLHLNRRPAFQAGQRIQRIRVDPGQQRW
jgi:RNA-directed DNA polymerase